MKPRSPFPLLLLLGLAQSRAGSAGTVSGYVRDQNWYAQYSSNPYGVGYDEFAVNNVSEGCIFPQVPVTPGRN